MELEDYYSHGDGDVLIKCVYCECPCSGDMRNDEGEPCHEICFVDEEMSHGKDK